MNKTNNLMWLIIIGVILLLFLKMGIYLNDMRAWYLTGVYNVMFLIQLKEFLICKE